MNNENIFFNPGDAIASSHDFKEVRRSAEIIKANNPTTDKLIIVSNQQNGEYGIYLASKAKDAKHGKQFKIVKKI